MLLRETSKILAVSFQNTIQKAIGMYRMDYYKLYTSTVIYYLPHAGLASLRTRASALKGTLPFIGALWLLKPRFGIPAVLMSITNDSPLLICIT